ncbi:MAG: hypothetical protein K2G03_01545, partial [Bacilli bacterium]|nr:hypothetical protein [Bacilli bacterium]
NEVGIDRESDNEFATLVLLDRLINENAQEDINELSMDEIDANGNVSYVDGSELEDAPMPEDSMSEKEAYFVKEREKKSNTLLVYNTFLEEYGEELGVADVAYLSTLRDDQSLVAVHGVDGIYNNVDLDDEEKWLIVDDGNSKIRLSEKENNDFGSYYYDILNFGYYSDVLSDEELENSMPFGKFVSKYELSPAGFCLPTYGIIEASEEILKEIEEMYGKNVAELVRVKGLPLPYYDYTDIQNVQLLDNNLTLGLSN